MLIFIRNTVATVIVLVVAALGLEWNHQALDERLASAPPAQVVTVSPSPTASSEDAIISVQDFEISLGEAQRFEIKTVPNSELNLTLYPEKQTDLAPKIFEGRTDQLGLTVIETEIDDFRFIGRVTAIVEVASDDNIIKAQASFLVRSRGPSILGNLGQPEPRYYHPLLP